MFEPAAWVSMVLAGVLAVWALIGAARDQRPSRNQLIGAAVLEVLLLAQAIGGAVALAVTDRQVEGITFIGYHLTAVTILVAGVGWGIADKSRWGNGVFAIVCATEIVLVLRLLQLWAGHP